MEGWKNAKKRKQVEIVENDIVEVFKEKEQFIVWGASGGVG